MLKHLWTILCLRSIVDSESNTISLIDVIDKLELKGAAIKKGANSKFAIPTSLSLNSLWEKTSPAAEVDAFLQIDLLSPDEEKLFSVEYPFKVPSDKRRMRTKALLHGVPIKGSGLYKFIVKIKYSNDKPYKVMAETTLEVELIP